MSNTFLPNFTETYGSPNEGVTLEQFRAFLGASTKKTDDQLNHVLLLAKELVDRFCGERRVRVPQVVLDEAVLQVGQALYSRSKDAGTDRSNQYATDGENLQFIPRKDAMYYAYPLLRPYVGWL